MLRVLRSKTIRLLTHFPSAGLTPLAFFHRCQLCVTRFVVLHDFACRSNDAKCAVPSLRSLRIASPLPASPQGDTHDCPRNTPPKMLSAGTPLIPHRKCFRRGPRMIFRLIFLPCLCERLLLASQKCKTLHRSSFLRFALQLSLCRSFLLRGCSLTLALLLQTDYRPMSVHGLPPS